MHPEARERPFFCEVFRLRDLAGVMWKSQVRSSSMNIDLGSEVAHCHRATFDMPAGPSWSPRTLPGRFSRSLRLPEHKVQGILFARISGEIAAFIGNLEHCIVIMQTYCVRHLAKFRVLFHAEKDTALAFISKATLDQGLCHLNDCRYLLRRFSVDIRTTYMQRIHILEEA